MKRHLRPCCPLFKTAGGNTLVISTLSGVPGITYDPMMLLCKGTCAPVAPLFKGHGGSAPVMHPRSGVSVSKWRWHVLLADARRTVTWTFSIGALRLCWRAWHWKFEKYFINLLCITVKFGMAWCSVWGGKPHCDREWDTATRGRATEQKPPRNFQKHV